MQIDNETRILGSIAGNQSNLGTTMHNAVYEAMGLNCVYLALNVKNVKNAVEGLRALNFRGSAVSMPHKQGVMKYLNEINPIAKKIGAVNTILNENGILTGYNSDWTGAIDALKEKTNLENKKVALIGAGGAARAIAYGLKKSKSKVVIFNRTVEKAKELAKEFDLEFGGNIENFKKIQDYDILINATSIGFYPQSNKSIIEKDQLKENKIVMDIVFKPLETLLLRYAKSKNCITIPGYRMLIYQALFQIKLWTNKKAPFEVMEKALLTVLK